MPRVAHLYCKRKGCAVRSVSGSFETGRRYKCPECGRTLSTTAGAKK